MDFPFDDEHDDDEGSWHRCRSIHSSCSRPMLPVDHFLRVLDVFVGAASFLALFQ